jgi:hypothetical protein
MANATASPNLSHIYGIPRNQQREDGLENTTTFVKAQHESTNDQNWLQIDGDQTARQPPPRDGMAPALPISRPTPLL